MSVKPLTFEIDYYEFIDSVERENFSSLSISFKLKAWIESKCEDLDITVGSVDMLESLRSARVVVEIVPIKGLK